MLINLRNREGKLIVKDVLDIDFDMSVEEENNKYVINITPLYNFFIKKISYRNFLMYNELTTKHFTKER